MVETRRDWVPAVTIGLGAIGIGAGIYFFLKRPEGVLPGDTVRASFSFDYLGLGGSYVLLVRFGWRYPIGGGFNPEEGLDRYMRNITLSGPDTYQLDVDCLIPDTVKASTYDAEGSILTPTMLPGQDWIIRHFADKVFEVK